MMIKENPNRRHFHLYWYLNFHGFLCRFWLCPSIYILKINENMLLVLGPPYRHRKSLGITQTQVNPNANRGWPIKPVNHIRPQLTRLCSNSSWTSTSQNADGAPNTEDFNAMGYFDHDSGFRHITSLWKLLPNRYVPVNTKEIHINISNILQNHNMQLYILT